MTPFEGPDVPLVNIAQTLSLSLPNFTSFSSIKSTVDNSSQFKTITSSFLSLVTLKTSP